MADKEALRQVLLSKGFRRTILVALLAIGAWVMVSAVEQGRVADRGVEAIAQAVAGKDRASCSENVKDPSLEAQLLDAPHAELSFVRPVDSEWTRIGFLIKSSATASSANPLFI